MKKEIFFSALTFLLLLVLSLFIHLANSGLLTKVSFEKKVISKHQFYCYKTIDKKKVIKKTEKDIYRVLKTFNTKLISQLIVYQIEENSGKKVKKSEVGFILDVETINDNLKSELLNEYQLKIKELPTGTILKLENQQAKNKSALAITRWKGFKHLFNINHDKNESVEIIEIFGIGKNSKNYSLQMYL